MREESRKHQMVRQALESGCHFIILLLVVFLFSLQMIQVFSLLEALIDSNASVAQMEGFESESEGSVAVSAGIAEEDGGTGRQTEGYGDVQVDAVRQLEDMKREIRTENPFVSAVLDSPRLGGIFYAALMVMTGLSWLFMMISSGSIRFEDHIPESVFLCLNLFSAILFLILGYGTSSVRAMTWCCSASMLWGPVAAVWKKRRIRTILAGILRISLVVLNLVLFSDLPVFVLAVLFLRSVLRITKISLSHVRTDVLAGIIRKTHAMEILMGMVMQILLSSILLALFDPGIPTFPDALWYCFALVTTIGFGDITATSILGRILSVFLGIYGIIVVALITSIIVNFYSEVKNDD